MAATGYTPISLYYSTTAAAVPTSGNLVSGELALNIADMKLYAKNSAGTVTLLASNASTVAGVSSFTAGTTGFTPSTATTGAVTLAGTLNVANGGTGLTTLTAGRIPYGAGTSALGNSANLIFDGNNLGLGVTPSAWNTSVFKALQINAQGALMATSASMQMGNNIFYDGAYKFIGTGYANRYYQTSGQHIWTVSTASGSAGGTITETQAMTLDASGNLGIATASPVAKLDLAGDYREGVVTANTSTAYTISLAAGTVQILTLTGNCTYTFPTPVAGKSFTLVQKQDATGSRTVTWPASVDWPSATAPTLTATASKADKFVFTAIDGSNWLGSVAGQNYTV